MKLDKEKERTKILNRILLLKALNHVDERGAVILQERYKFPTWIDCKSCKFCDGDTNDWPRLCLKKYKMRQIDVVWGYTKPKQCAWFCLVHEFKEKEPK